MNGKRKKGGGGKPPPKRPAGPGPATAKPNLVVLKDGKPLPEAQARDIWMRFSAHMDAHEGDMAGFAKANGWASAAPEYRKGQAVLVIATH